jgi:carbon starvation protein
LRIAFNDYVDATLAAVFATIVVIMVAYGVLTWGKPLGNRPNTALEVDAAMAAGDD